MAASRERALRFSGESEQRPQQKLTRKVIQSINGVERKSVRGGGKRQEGRIRGVMKGLVKGSMEGSVKGSMEGSVKGSM